MKIWLRIKQEAAFDDFGNKLLLICLAVLCAKLRRIFIGHQRQHLFTNQKLPQGFSELYIKSTSVAVIALWNILMSSS